jgi:hypothetical protein
MRDIKVGDMVYHTKEIGGTIYKVTEVNVMHRNQICLAVEGFNGYYAMDAFRHAKKNNEERIKEREAKHAT